MTIAVIADIVGSRDLPDRASAQAEIEQVVAQVEADYPSALLPLAPTVGDEFQGTFARLDDALCALLLFQLALSDAVQCRFGVGVGEIRSVSASSPIQDGPGWWAARTAIDLVHREQQRILPATRIRVVVGGDEEDGGMSIAAVNAYLLARDQLVHGMSERVRRLTYGRCLGRTQTSLARQEDITQSAVSQMLAAGGAAAVVEGFALLSGRRP